MTKPKTVEDCKKCEYSITPMTTKEFRLSFRKTVISHDEAVKINLCLHNREAAKAEIDRLIDQRNGLGAEDDVLLIGFITVLQHIRDILEKGLF